MIWIFPASLACILAPRPMLPCRRWTSCNGPWLLSATFLCRRLLRSYELSHSSSHACVPAFPYLILTTLNSVLVDENGGLPLVRL
jgi:hypothetical protein